MKSFIMPSWLGCAPIEILKSTFHREGIPLQTPLQRCVSHTVCYHQNFQCFAWPLHSYIKCITPALYFAWPKLKCFWHPWLTLLLPQQKFAPSPLSQRGGEPSAATGLSPAEDSEENGHKELAQNVYTTYSYSRCVVCVWVCVSMWMHMYDVYTSACKQCWLDA